MHKRFEQAPCGFISLNQESYIVEVNETFLQWTGYTKDIIGQHFDSLLTPANKMIFYSYFYPVVNIEGSIEELYINFKHATGEMMPYLLNARKLVDDNEHRTDCVFMQMKKRIDYEMELRATKEQLEDAYKAKDIAFHRLEEIYAEIERKQMELLEVNSDLIRVTNTDKLTNIANRKFFQEKLDEHYQQFEKNGMPLSLLILDIDFFKRVNDTYGHLVGDKVLVELAKLMKEAAREMDVPCRYGGEEFVVILPNTKAEEAIEIGKLYNEIVQRNDWPEIHTLTISVGVATIVNGLSQEQLIEQADQALYASKLNGRNQVKHYHQLKTTN